MVTTTGAHLRCSERKWLRRMAASRCMVGDQYLGPTCRMAFSPWRVSRPRRALQPRTGSPNRLRGAGVVIPGSALRDQQGLRSGADGPLSGIVDGGTHEANAAGLGGRGLEADPLAAGVGVQVNRGFRVDERPRGRV